MAWNDDFMESPLSSGENPGYVALRIRTFKTEVQNIINDEHYLGTTGDGLTYQSQHKSGSAKAYYAPTASSPEDRPDGTTLGEIDAGRLWIDSTTGEWSCWSGTEWVAILGEVALSEDEDPSTMTIESLTEKLNAIVSQLKLISGGDEWTTAPEDNIVNMKADIATNFAATGTNASAILVNAGDIDTLESSLAAKVSTGSAASLASLTLSGTLTPEASPSEGNFSVSTSGSIIPRGIYTFESDHNNNIVLEVKIGTGFQSTANYFGGGTVFSDGVSVRLRGISSSDHMYYKKF